MRTRLDFFFVQFPEFFACYKSLLLVFPPSRGLTFRRTRTMTSPNRASLLINGVGGGILSCVLFNNALESVKSSRRATRGRAKRPNAVVRFSSPPTLFEGCRRAEADLPLPRDRVLHPKQLPSWFKIDMDNADVIGFGNVGDPAKRNGKSRPKTFTAKSVAKTAVVVWALPLYGLVLLGRLVKRKACKAAHRVANHATDHVAERAAQILREEFNQETLLEHARASVAKCEGDIIKREARVRVQETDDDNVAASPCVVPTTDKSLQCEISDDDPKSTAFVTKNAGYGYEIATGDQTGVAARGPGAGGPAEGVFVPAEILGPAECVSTPTPETPAAPAASKKNANPVPSPPELVGWDLVDDGSGMECA